MGLGIQELLARDLRNAVPAGARSLLDPGEQVVVYVPGMGGGIIATEARVLVVRPFNPATVFEYRDLTGVDAHLGIFSKRYVALRGPGLTTEFRFGMNGRATNATSVHVWNLRKARTAAEELETVVSSLNRSA